MPASSKEENRRLQTSKSSMPALAKEVATTAALQRRSLAEVQAAAEVEPQPCRCPVFSSFAYAQLDAGAMKE